MQEHKFEFRYKVYNDIGELEENDAWLLSAARKATTKAYAPYSNFQVGAIALLGNGEIMEGTNQENASYPVGICAERVLLGTIATRYPDVIVKTIAVSYNNKDGKSDHPISPCGMCRQSIQEYENRTRQPIRLILSGQEGKVYIVESAGFLLPFAFTNSELI